MKRKYLLAALMLAGLGIAQSNAQDAPQMTMKQYTDHLLSKYGENGKIIAGTINGKTDKGAIVPDFYPPPDSTVSFDDRTIIPLSLPISEQNDQCPAGQVITRINSGAYSFPWCARYQTINNVAYEAKRDTLYYSAGRWTYVTSYRFDCQNASDLAQMPTSVIAAVCP